MLDAGFTHNFLIREDQLSQWAGLRSKHLRELGHIKPYGESIPLRSANEWLHRNKPGQRDEFVQAEPYLIELDSGIGVCLPAIARAPRLPLLGLRGLWCGGLESRTD